MKDQNEQEHQVGLEPTFPHYGCGVLAAERPVPGNVLGARPEAISMGSDGLEPSPARVRTECAAANTLIPGKYSVFSYQLSVVSQNGPELNTEN